MAFDFFASDNNGNLIQSPMCVVGSTTTDSSGNFSLDISNAGLTHIYSVSVTAFSTSTASLSQLYASVSTFSISTVAGKVQQPVNVVLSSPSMTPVGSGKTVYVTVIGDQN